MSEQLAFIRKKGGGLAKVTEKVLWTNPSPSSDFAAQDITLSDDIDNYDYVAIKYAYSTVLSTGMRIATILSTSEDIKKWKYNAGEQHNLAALAVQNAANTYYSRTITCKTNTSLRFGTCYQMATNTASNSLCIPLQILGLNIDTDDKVIDYEIVALGEGTSAVTTAVSIALNDSLSNYAYVVLSMTPITSGAYIPSANTNTALQDIVEVEYFKRNSIMGAFTTGSTGSASFQSSTYTYVDDTHINYQKSTSTSRTVYVYGIKATRKEVKKPEKYDTTKFQSVAANGIPTFVTKGKAKAVFVNRYVTGGAKSVTYTNVNPSTGEVDNTTLWSYDSSDPSTIYPDTSFATIITDNSVTFSKKFSSSAYLVQLSYTYE